MPTTPQIAFYNETLMELNLKVEDRSWDRTSWTIFYRSVLQIPDHATDQVPISGISPGFYIHIDSLTKNLAPVMLAFKREIRIMSNYTQTVNVGMYRDYEDDTFTAEWQIVDKEAAADLEYEQQENPYELIFTFFHPAIEKTKKIPFQIKLEDLYLNVRTYEFNVVITPYDTGEAEEENNVSANITVGL